MKSLFNPIHLNRFKNEMNKVGDTHTHCHKGIIRSHTIQLWLNTKAKKTREIIRQIKARSYYQYFLFISFTLPVNCKKYLKTSCFFTVIHIRTHTIMTSMKNVFELIRTWANSFRIYFFLFKHVLHVVVTRNTCWFRNSVIYNSSHAIHSPPHQHWYFMVFVLKHAYKMESFFFVHPLGCIWQLLQCFFH